MPAPLRPGTAHVAASRAEAIDLIARKGLPNRRVEAWKYTDLRALMPAGAPFATRTAAQAVAASAPVDALGPIGLPMVRLVNGHVLDALPSLPAGVAVTSLAEALAAGDPRLEQLGIIEATRANAAFALNTAFLRDGLLITVTREAGEDAGLHVAFLQAGATPAGSAARIVVRVEPGASFTLVESHSGPDGVAYPACHAVEAALGEGARLTHMRLDANGSAALSLSTLAVTLGREASLRTLNVADGAAAARHQVFVEYQGEHASADIRGATMLDGTRHADNTLHIDHAVAHGASRETFRTVIDGEATGVFQGKIVVRPHAQKTDGRMKSDALLLSDGASMNGKPELEIFADDVQCAHGATCGALDEDLLFYLMARGLPRAEAEALMIESFLGEALDGVENEALHEALSARVRNWLARRGGAA